MRLSSTPGLPLSRARQLDLHVGGAEANVAVGLAGLGHDTAMLTALPDGPLGDRALAHLREAGVATDQVLRGSGRIGLYFLDPGGALRAPELSYDRARSRFAVLDAAEIDWERVFADAAHLHLSGITPALGEASAEVALTAARRARAVGLSVSFDVNFRKQLWDRRACDPIPLLRALIAETDLLFAGARDAALLLVAPAIAETAAPMFFEAFPSLSRVASADRTVIAPGHHRLTGRLMVRDAAEVVQAIDIPGVIDRIGTGDAFAAGILHGLRAGADAAATLDHGLALAALAHGVAGDAAQFFPAELAQFDAQACDVRR